jgi:NDP-sugar pyrophosphorylase family protein
MTSPPRHALVLTAGLGTRLRPLTEVRAKPAVPIGGEPIVRRIARWLAGYGVTDLVLNLHHLPSSLTAVMGEGRDLGLRVRYSWEQPVVLGTAGGPRQALPLIDSDVFLIVNGDTMTDVDLGALHATHVSSKALVTLALAPNAAPARYGGVRLDRDSRVVGFVPRGAAEGSFHMLGVQVAHAEAFAALPAGQALNSIGGVYDDLIASKPGSIVGFVSDATFWDIGTVSDYWRTSMGFLDRIARDGGSSRSVRLHPSARVTRSVLWDEVTVGAGSVLDECIVTDGARVPDGATYRRTILMADRDSVRAVPFDVE